MSPMSSLSSSLIGHLLRFRAVTEYNSDSLRWRLGISTPPSQFNPEQLDTDQWVRVAESMHAKYIILVAKHVGGFCLWQTDSSDYSVGHTPWQGGIGDVLADFTQSCRKRGMLWGVYVYPGDL